MKKDSFVPRRHFLKMAGLAAAATSFGFTKSNTGNTFKPPVENPVLNPVNVSADRLIRTVVGLRPFRPSGFNLSQEKKGNKIIIHNYGHGGGGISLSWGTAKLAVDMAVKTGYKKFAVLGSGVIGMSTGILLLKKGFDVTIYTKDVPPNTTSNIAAAFWMPVSVFENGHADSKFLSQLDEASRLSHRMFQDYLGDKYGIWWVDQYDLGRVNEEFPGGNDLYPEINELRDPKTYFGYPLAQHYKSMMIETPVYLNSLMQDFLLFGGKLKIREFNSLTEINNLSETVVMNCTGLGSQKLFKDDTLVPVRGQLCVLLPQPEIKYSYATGDHNNILYMFPRKDGIILGGTIDKDNWSLEPDQQVTKRILKGHSAIAKSIGG